MLILTCLAGALLGGFGRRIAGGLIGDWFGRPLKHLIATIVFGVFIGAAFALGGGPLWLAAVLGFGVWAGHCAVGLRDAAGMGRFGPDNASFTWKRFARDFAMLSVYGAGVVAIGALAAGHHTLYVMRNGPTFGFTLNFTPSWMQLGLLAAGLTISPVYAACWAAWTRRFVPLVVGVSRNPLEMGEWVWGAALGIGAVLSAGL